MPEMPEVETIASDLSEKLLGRKIISLDLVSVKSVKNTPIFFKKRLVGLLIKKIGRRGKLLIFEISGVERYFLLIHLKMTGQLIYIDKKTLLVGGHSFEGSSSIDGAGSKLPNSHTRVVINFENGARLFFNDLRRFGYLKIVDANELEKILKNNYGPEPLSKEFTTDYLKVIFKKRKTNIKALLLNQTLVAGLGNIYVDESLFASKIRPTRVASSLKSDEIKSLYFAINAIIKKAIKFRGTTFNNYVDSNGKKGNFSKHLKVYGRKNENCLACGTPITRIKIAGRGTHYCPNCQK